MRDDHFTFVADDGAKIFVYRWRPDLGVGRAVVHIAHGLAEHGGRYERLAESLTNSGYVVCANDHRGHGRTAATQDDIGHLGDQGGWGRIVSDLGAVCREEKESHRGIPLILIGHSMGSLLAQHAIYSYPDLFDAAAMSGANGIVSPIVRFGKVIAKFETLRLGKRGRSDLINQLTFETFNKAFKPNRTAFDWLSRDEAEVDKYIADPLCGFTASNQLWVDLIDATLVAARPENRARIRKDLPLYLFSGMEDQVNAEGRGCTALAESYRQIGLRNVSYKIYPRARHETLNEINRDEVTGHLIEWADAVVALLRNGYWGQNA
jgi:alpha-beta hydrolase superfamily lysophospholipase